MKESRFIYVVLTDTGSLLTKAIKRFTKAQYNHVSISFDPKLESLYSFGRKHPSNPFFGGFVEESFYSGTFKRFENTSCLVLKMPMEDLTYDQLTLNVEFFKENMDQYHYNFIGLFGAALGKQISRRNGYYCTHFVSEVLSDANVNLWDTPDFLVRPQDFQLHTDFSVVYEGLLREFN